MNIERLSGMGHSILNVPNSNKENISRSFSDILRDAMAETQTLRQLDVNNNAMLAIRELDNLHQPMIDMQKANLALQFTLQVRNKILDAYQEIMRMQI